MEGLLDNTSPHCRELPTADQLWVQVRMPWKVQMLPIWSYLHYVAANVRVRKSHPGLVAGLFFCFVFLSAALVGKL